MIYSLIHRLWDLKESGLRYRTLQQLNAFAYAKPCDQIAHQQQQLRILFEAAQHTPYYQTIIAREKIDLTHPNPYKFLANFRYYQKQIFAITMRISLILRLIKSIIASQKLVDLPACRYL